MSAAICGRTAPCDISRPPVNRGAYAAKQRWVACSGCGTVARSAAAPFERAVVRQMPQPRPGLLGTLPELQHHLATQHAALPRCAVDKRTARPPRRRHRHDPRRTAGLAPCAGRRRTARRRHGLARAPKGQRAAGRTRRRRAAPHPRALDELPAGKTVAHLRSVLVATGLCRTRDEQHVATRTMDQRHVQRRAPTPTERRIAAPLRRLAPCCADCDDACGADTHHTPQDLVRATSPRPRSASSTGSPPQAHPAPTARQGRPRRMGRQRRRQLPRRDRPLRPLGREAPASSPA